MTPGCVRMEVGHSFDLPEKNFYPTFPMCSPDYPQFLVDVSRIVLAVEIRDRTGETVLALL